MNAEELKELLIQFGPLAIEYGLKILAAILILIVGRFVANRMKRWVQRWGEKSTHVDNTFVPIIANTVSIVIMLITLMAVLNEFGVETTSIVALLGAAGLAIGLALQGTLTNIASGVMLLVLRPFGVGDAVKIQGNVYIVQEIGLFMTKMKTLDGIHVFQPNSNVWGQEIHNFSISDPRRIDLVMGISYDDDIDRAIEVIKDEIFQDSRVLKDPEPLVAVGELADSSVNLLVRPWASNQDFFPTMLDLRKKLKQRLDKEGFTIPFPQRDVHLYKTS